MAPLGTIRTLDPLIKSQLSDCVSSWRCVSADPGWCRVGRTRWEIVSRSGIWSDQRSPALVAARVADSRSLRTVALGYLPASDATGPVQALKVPKRSDMVPRTEPDEGLKRSQIEV